MYLMLNPKSESREDAFVPILNIVPSSSAPSYLILGVVPSAVPIFIVLPSIPKPSACPTALESLNKMALSVPDNTRLDCGNSGVIFSASVTIP